MNNPTFASWESLKKISPIRLYAGGFANVPGYEGWIGLSIYQVDHRHIPHDMRNPLPIPDNYVDAFQAEDVLEHIALEYIPAILQEIHRVLKPNAYFRISVPDYRCDVLINRSEKDASGKILFDPGGGGTREKPQHVWFPYYESVKSLIETSPFKNNFEFFHYYGSDGAPVMKKIDYTLGLVRRTPDHDPRIQNPRRPMSIVVDCYKN